MLLPPSVLGSLLWEEAAVLLCDLPPDFILLIQVCSFSPPVQLSSSARQTTLSGGNGLGLPWAIRLTALPIADSLHGTDSCFVFQLG